jgi:anti-sigma-K factor RskA
LPTDRTYQLWGVIGGKTISLGLLGPDPSVVPFSVAGDGSVQAFAITAEHAGGVVQSTNQPVVSGEVTA